ncbi:hypothetical protein Val02_72320 [Virgisporangium aliadipatigenens]|uniref:Uncharacterized protein n=1 Tax=Virgisporangium aliadipatigenens TaxID=741659 RepID=A0A8J3YV33_9ACTN|nr:hypothetical protein [Virgisporangium aliadipatigenens]GIJ50346.1 hypothetical protein Val02_72320 [Virgisporangium aliadipatigenens]
MGDGFAGDTLLRLAREGRFVVDSVRADRLIADIERTLAVVRGRLLLIDAWRHSPTASVELLPPGIADGVVDILFADQIAPSRLESALRELPKYVVALRLASRDEPAGHGPGR